MTKALRKNVSHTTKSKFFFIQNYIKEMDLCILSFFSLPSTFLIAQKVGLRKKKKKISWLTMVKKT